MNTFSETQKFRQWWLWLIIVASLAVPVIITYFNLPANSTGKKIRDMAIGAAVPCLIILLFLSTKLKTQINETGVAYRFVPFHLKTFKIEWTEIEKAYIRKYRPLPEYGGWGMRAGLGGLGRAYNVSGNIGLQLQLTSGKKILFGTQKPDEITAVLNFLVSNGTIKKSVISVP